VYSLAGTVGGSVNYHVYATFTVTAEAIGLLANTLTFLNAAAGYLSISK